MHYTSPMPLTAAWLEECRLAGGIGPLQFPLWYALRMRATSRAIGSHVSRRRLEQIALAVLAEERRLGRALDDNQVRRFTRELDRPSLQAV